MDQDVGNAQSFSYMPGAIHLLGTWNGRSFTLDRAVFKNERQARNCASGYTSSYTNSYNGRRRERTHPCPFARL